MAAAKTEIATVLDSFRVIFEHRKKEGYPFKNRVMLNGVRPITQVSLGAESFWVEKSDLAIVEALAAEYGASLWDMNEEETVSFK